MIGRVERLNFRPAVDHWKAKGLDYSAILYQPDVPADAPRRCVTAQDHGLKDALDNELIAQCANALERGTPVSLRLPIRNVNRTVGTMLGYEVTRRYGAAGLPDNTISLRFTGSAGQSFGAFVPSRHHARARGRRERLRRQGPLGRQGDRVSAEAGDVRARGEHRHRERRAVWRDERRGVFPRRRRRALCGAQQRRLRRRRRHRRPRLRVHDRRPRRRAGQDRPELRRGDVRRHRLRARRDRHVQRALQPGDGRSRAARARSRTSSWCAI